ncbi:MAG: PAS domain S-box protein [Acidobacteria bacterium]|nr:PAS domain S-box protein [Acidobacteriota bacterium]
MKTPIQNDPAAIADPGDSAFLSQLLDAVQHSIIAINRDEAVTYWNGSATRLYGYTRDEALGSNIMMLTAAGSEETARAIIDSVWNGQPWSGEYDVSHRDGGSVHARIQLFPIFGAGHEVSGIIGVSEDISAEAAARDTLAKTQERFELLARSTSDAMWDWDVETDTVWANSAYEALVGPRVPGKSAKDTWLARVHEEDRPPLLSRSSTATTFRNEYRFLNYATNQYARILDRGFLFRDESGKLTRVIGAMTDISHLKSIEQAYRESEERFRRIFEQSPLGIAITGPTGSIVQTNAAYRTMLGYSAEELTGRNVLDITHADDRDPCARGINELFTLDQPLVRIEKRYVRKDGSIVWAAITATILPPRDGFPKLGLALVEDISDQRRVGEELAAAKAKAESAMGAKMRFLAQISHEIRSPMAGVLGMLELLDGTLLDAEQREQVSSARQAATSLLGMLEEILDLTRLDQQRLALRYGPYSPSQLVHEVAALYRAKAATKNLTFTVDASRGVPAQHIADPARVRQILINLIDNAVKFTSKGSVAVTVSPAVNVIQFVVDDTGAGIPMESIDSVFETFSAISAHTSASVGGTGLGLAISQRLARLMGGDLTVTSSVGRGSRFVLSLPADSSAESTYSPPDTLAIRARFPGRRILVVEDNHINQRVAAGLLRRLECQVDVASTGVEALQMALPANYDAIFMDAMMPIMDGFETTAELRRREPTGRRVPIIGLTALASEEDRERCLAAGMDDYISKPTNFQTLESVLVRWLSADSEVR